MLKGADMVFIAAGEGGGTGTGGAPIVAEIARRRRALTIGIVDAAIQRSRAAAGRCRPRTASVAQGKVDTLIVIPNDRLLQLSDEHTSMLNAFKMCDEVLLQGVRASPT